MSRSPIIALRAAIRAALAVLPGALAIHDGPPRDAAFPFLSFAATRERDLSTQTDRGSETLVDLDVWGDADSMRPALALADRVIAALDEAPLALMGHRLVDLRFVQMETRREQKGRVARLALRFRAFTECL